jgi:hypothetical protein
MTFFKKMLFKLFLLIFKIFIQLRFDFLASFLIFLSLRKLYFTNNENKNLVILEKSYGIEDFRGAYSKKNYNLNIYVLQRKVFIIIFKSVFKSRAKELRDNYYIINDQQLKNRQDKLLDLLNSILNNLKKFINISAFVSFNFKYFAERELHKACKKNNIKFIVCHKECNVFDGEIKYYNKILKNVGEFKGDLITVYNERYKKLLIENKIFDPDKIIVTGMPRADVLFNVKDNNVHHVLVFLISTNRSLKYIFEANTSNKISMQESLLNWDSFAQETILAIIEVAKKYPTIKFIFKTKIEKDPQTITQQNIVKNSKLENCKIEHGGFSAKLIKNAKFVIGFNTTGIIESLIAQKIVLVPYFGLNADNFKKKFILNDSNLTIKANTLEEFKKIIALLLNNQFKKKNNKVKNQKKLFYEHIGNYDGKSGEKLINEISKLII